MNETFLAALEFYLNVSYIYLWSLEASIVCFDTEKPIKTAAATYK